MMFKGLAVVPAAVGIGLMAAAETPLYVGGGSLILGLAALFIREFFKNQAATWAIAKERKNEVEELRDRLHYAHWENSVLRYRLGDRLSDPGPYVPRSEVTP